MRHRGGHRWQHGNMGELRGRLPGTSVETTPQMTVAPGNEVGSCCEYLKKLLYKKNSCDLLQIVVFQTGQIMTKELLEAFQQKLESFLGR